MRKAKAAITTSVPMAKRFLDGCFMMGISANDERLFPTEFMEIDE
jgi:hypothetical protein